MRIELIVFWFCGTRLDNSVCSQFLQKGLLPKLLISHLSELLWLNSLVQEFCRRPNTCNWIRPVSKRNNWHDSNHLKKIIHGFVFLYHKSNLTLLSAFVVPIEGIIFLSGLIYFLLKLNKLITEWDWHYGFSWLPVSFCYQFQSKNFSWMYPTSWCKLSLSRTFKIQWVESTWTVSSFQPSRGPCM